MNLNRPDYFDVLPFHPRPKPLESLTSYITRLAQGNGFKGVGNLISIAFPRQQSISRGHFRSDYTPTSWGLLSQVTICSETELLATTFYHLTQKFGRASRPQAMGRFLQSCLSPTLRYCPYCLAEDAFYALPWRLLTLSGCAKHGCYLLEQCGHCGQPVPLFSQPLTMSVCPACRGDLSACQTPSLSNNKWQQIIEHDQDLRFLMAACPTCPVDPQDAFRSTGRRLAYWRLQQGLVVSEAAQQFELPDAAIYRMEGQSGGGAIFERYVRYAASLGVTFRQLFNTPLPQDLNEQNWRVWCHTIFSREQMLVEQVQAAIRTLEAEEKPVTQIAITQYLGKHPATLRRYPRVKAIMEKVVANRAVIHQQKLKKREYEQTLLSSVQSAIDRLIVEDILPTQVKVCGRVGILKSTLYNYPRARALIATAAVELLMRRQRQLQQRQAALPQQNHLDPYENALVESVQTAIKQLKADDKLVTQKAIAQLVGKHHSYLRRYPQIRFIFEQVLIDFQLDCHRQVLHRLSQLQSLDIPRTCQHEAKHVEAVQVAIAQLEAEGTSLNPQNIAQTVGLKLSTLRLYPQIKEILATVSAQFKQKQRQQREQQLVAQVQVAIAQVETLNIPLTQANVAQLVGLSARALREYPQVNLLLKQVTVKRHQLSIIQRQQRDRDLADKVQQAAHILANRGQTVSKQAIGQIVGMNPVGLKMYPHTQVILNRLTQR